jgi:methyl-accepting chemotaxis protein
MDQNSRLSHLNLHKKILFLMFGITLAVVTLTLAIVYTITGTAINRILENDINKTQVVFENYQSLRNRKIKAEGHLIGEIPFLKALISTKDHATILGFANNFRERIGADLILITDEGGKILAGTDPRLGSGDLSSEKVIRDSLSGNEVSGTLTVENTLFRVRSAPIRVGDSSLGTMTLGFKMDDHLAREIKGMTDSEISIIVGSKIVASTWEDAGRKRLADFLPGLEAKIQLVVNEGVPSPLFDLPMGETFVSVLTPLGTDTRDDGVYLIQRSRDQVTSFLAKIRNAIVLGSAILLLGASWASYAIARHIASPITDLVAGSMAMAEGNLSITVEVKNKDELGVLANAFNGMARKLRELLFQVRTSTLAVTDVADKIDEGSRSVVTDIRQQERAVEDTSASILQMSSSIQQVNRNVGSLSETASDTSSAILEMDASSTEIAGHMDQLSGSIDICSSSISEMNANIREIGQNLETLSRATETTSSSLEEFNTSVQQVENNAAQSQVLSEKTVQEAQKGVQSVQSTIQGMDAIKASFTELQDIVSNLSTQSNSIGKVVKVITEITGQTNLLSLNAAIIAAQAGEHGKGFSIVALEIKNLADRTAASTREISNLIKGVQNETATAVNAMHQGAEKVMRGVSLSNDAGHVLQVIIESSQRSTQMVMAIVHATQEQAKSIQGVNRAMLEVRDMVEQTNRSTREQEVASHEVMNSIDHIRTLGLKVKDSTSEQSKSSRSIATAMNQVTEMIRQILNATNEQKRGTERIQQALNVFKLATDGNIQRAAELGDIIQVLSTQSKELEQAIGRFKI